MALTNQQIATRNSFLMVLEGTLFWAGLSFLEGNTVISVFMDQTTGSAAMAGLAATLKSGMFIVGQFILGMFVHRIRIQSHFMAIVGCLSRPLMLLMVPLLLGGLSGQAAAWVFLILYGLLFFADGMVGLCWNEICARTLAPSRRGEVIALQQTFSGLVGLASGAIIRQVFASEITMQQQFAIIFGLSGVLTTLDAVILCLIHDRKHASRPDMKPLSPARYMTTLVPLISGNPGVRRVLLARALYLLTLMSAPINILFGIRQGGLNAAQQATLVFMPVIGQIIAGVLWARVSKRLGYPIMMLMAEALGIACALLNLLCMWMARMGLSVMIPLSLAMILVSLNTSAYLAFQNHMVVIVPEDKRALYLVLASILMAPLSLATYFAGLISEQFGFLPVYLIMLAAGVCGVILIYRNFLSPNSPLPESDRRAEI